MFDKFKFWKKNTDPEPFVITRKDVVFSLSNINRCKKFFYQVIWFLAGSKDNIAFLKVESKEINYVMIPVELYDQLNIAVKNLKLYEDDVYVMSQIVKQLNDKGE